MGYRIKEFPGNIAGSVFTAASSDAIKPPLGHVFVAFTVLTQASFDASGGLVAETATQFANTEDAAGDLADPHGTHKVCIELLFDALKNLKKLNFMKDCWIWLYRGAWHEWDSHEIDMAVPLSPEQVLRKRRAIFYHQSQNNSVMFQGDDEREFWQRVEERNREIAITYNDLGMADYQAMETFRRYHF